MCNLSFREITRPLGGAELASALSKKDGISPQLAGYVARTQPGYVKRCDSHSEATIQLDAAVRELRLPAERGVGELSDRDNDLLVQAGMAQMSRARLEVLRHIAIEEFPSKAALVGALVGECEGEFVSPLPLHSDSHFSDIAARRADLCSQLSKLVAESPRRVMAALKEVLSVGSTEQPVEIAVGSNFLLKSRVQDLSRKEWADLFLSNLRSSHCMNDFGHGLCAAEWAAMLRDSAMATGSSVAPSERPYLLSLAGLAGYLFHGRISVASKELPRDFGFKYLNQTRTAYLAARRALESKRIDGVDVSGVEGCKRFATSYACGDVEAAYKLLASVALMEGLTDAFRALGWSWKGATERS